MIRCSSLPLISKCAAAATPPHTVIRSNNEAARTGTAGHEAMAQVVQGISPYWQRIADRHQVDLDEVRILTAMARQMWEDLKEFFPNPMVETELIADDMWLSGHPDVRSWDPAARRVSVLDWKFGRLRLDHSMQVTAYAWLAMQRFPEAQEAYVAVAWVRDQQVEGSIVTREQVETEIAEVRKQLASPEVYNPGEWCGFCPRGHECPAKTQLLSQAALTLVPWANSVTVSQADRPAKVAAMVLDQCRLLEGAIDCARATIRADVEAAGGRVDVGDGREIVLTPYERTSVNFAAGEEVLRRHVGERLAEALTVIKGDVEQIVMDQASYGEKRNAVDRLTSALAAAGALETKQFAKLEVRRNG